MTEFAEYLLIHVAVLVLGVTTAIGFASRSRESRSVLVSLGMTVTVVSLLIAVTGRWIREGQGPFLTLYDILLSNTLSLGLIFLIAVLTTPAFRAATSAILPFLLLLGVWMLGASMDAVPLPASFDNGWLWVHVISGKLFLGICMLAAGAAAMLLFDRYAPSRSAGEQAHARRDLDAAIWPTLSAAFVCHSFMLVAGAVWAYSAWGRYWAWDPLETWSFVTWASMALLLHGRATYRRMPPVMAWSAVVAIFLLAVMTFLGVPFVSIAPHKGVM